jgi:hypothetical protein
MDDTVLLPTEGVEEKQTETTVVPWVDRRDRSWFTAFFITMGQGISNPRRLMNAIPETSSFGRALVYGSIHVVLQSIMNLGGFVLVMGLASAASGAGGIFAGVLGAIVATLLLGPVILLLWAGTAHVALRLTGETAYGFGRTHQAIAYSAGNNFLYGIPCIGLYFFWAGALWWAISAGFMLATAQRVRGWRAGLAVSVLPVLVVVGVVTLITLTVLNVQKSVAKAMASANPASSGALPTSERTRMSMLSAPFLQAQSNRVANLTHIAEVLQPGSVSEMTFTDVRERGVTTPITIGGSPLSAWGPNMSDESRRVITQAAVRRTPPDPAYRIGDRVFTHAGINLSNINEDDMSDQLWLVIGWRRSLKATHAAETVSVLRADWEILEMSSHDFAGMLQSQNTLRAGLALPALPMPDTVVDHEAMPAALPPPPAPAPSAP